MEFIELLASARQGVGPFGQVQEGEQVLIVADTKTVDSWVVDALRIAADERGASVTTMILPPPKAWSDPWPEMAVSAALEADVTIRLGGRSVVHSGIRELAKQKGKPFIIKANVSQRQHLASDYGRFPYEILREISRELYKVVQGKRNYHVTDSLGTDITVQLPDSAADKLPEGFLGDIIERDRRNNERGVTALDWPGATCGFLFSSDKSEGVIITGAAHFGEMPQMRLTVEGGRVTKIDGGGTVGDTWRKALGEYQNVDFKKRLGPGVNWVEEIMWGLHPKAPLERPKTQGQTITLSSRSSRVIHIAMGAGAGTHHHRDVEIDDPDVWVDDEKIIDRGRLLVLDNSVVRQVAKEFGDPDALLREL